MSMDTIADALTSIKNGENSAKAALRIHPASRLLKEVLGVMQEYGFVKAVEWKDVNGASEARVSLAGKINECRVIKPRYAVKKDEFEGFEKKYLPARDIGILIVSTSKGVVSHKKAKDMGLGGRLLAYVY